MVRIQHQRVAGLEGKRVFILFLRKHIVRRAELLDGGVVEPCAFLHFRSDQQAFTFDLSHFRFDVSAAADGQGICGYISAVESQHAGDGIPEGGFAVASIAVCDDERLHKNFPDSSKAADHLYIVDKLLILLKNQIQIILPELRSFTAG